MSASNSAIVTNQMEEGIRIQAPTRCQEPDRIPLHGEYKVPYAETSVPKQAVLMPKHIVLVVTHAGQYVALKPYREVVVFQNDVQDDGQTASGHFSLHVFDHIKFKGRGDYYILCSLGNYLSNVVRVTVT